MEIKRMPSHNLFSVALLFAAAVLGGCASKGRALMPAPESDHSPATQTAVNQVPQERRRSSIDLLYITDRADENSADSDAPYGEGRSNALAFGSALVELVPQMEWDELRRESLAAPRAVDIGLELGGVRELERYPAEPYPIMRASPDRLRRDPVVLQQHERVEQQLQEEVQRRLETAPTGQVLLFVHGFNETFASAAYTAAELCHFLGRSHVCALFTWPASVGGNPLFSYEKTTESALYSVGHLRKTLRTLAQTPGVSGIQLLAHSRGAAVALLALRELSIEAIAAGQEPAEAMKLENLILLSPDVDGEVASQQLAIFASDPAITTRWREERLPRFVRGRFTVYSSPSDRALGLSRWLFGSRARVGQLGPEDISEGYKELFLTTGNVDLIVYEGKRTDFFGHSYFHSNPRVSADLIELIRNGTVPGAPGRRLDKIGKITWAFPEPKRW
jgi:esterase/lipase superfamily enzyme